MNMMLLDALRHPAAAPHVGDYLTVADTVPTPAPGQGIYYITSATYQGATRYGRKTTAGHLAGAIRHCCRGVAPNPHFSRRTVHLAILASPEPAYDLRIRRFSIEHRSCTARRNSALSMFGSWSQGAPVTADLGRCMQHAVALAAIAVAVGRPGLAADEANQITSTFNQQWLDT